MGWLNLPETSIPCESNETPLSGHDTRLAVHNRGGLKYYLSPFEKSNRPLDCPYLARRNNRYRGRGLLAPGCKMGSLAGSRLARLSRCRERIKLTIGWFGARRASFGRRVFPARAADFQVFSAWATRMI